MQPTNVVNSSQVLATLVPWHGLWGWGLIVGFTGSAGTAVITSDKAALFTDGRYFNQASKQLDENWQLMKVGLLKVPTWQEWVADISSDGKVVGVDPNVFTVGIILHSLRILCPLLSSESLSPASSLLLVKC